jgi:RNA polymerase sigma-70 factor (ECF subfamily)
VTECSISAERLLVIDWTHGSAYPDTAPDSARGGRFVRVPLASIRNESVLRPAIDHATGALARPDLHASDASADLAMDRYASTGDTAAFEELYKVLAPRLYAFLFRGTRNQSEAEDLVQQTLLKMHCARGRFIRGAGVVPWAFSIARRLLIDRSRRAKVRAESAHDGGDANEVIAQLAALDVAADEWLHAKSLAKIIDDELERLPAASRLAFELVKQDGLSHADAAKVLGTTVMAVKLRTHRACAALRAALQKSAEMSRS